MKKSPSQRKEKLYSDWVDKLPELGVGGIRPTRDGKKPVMMVVQNGIAYEVSRGDISKKAQAFKKVDPTPSIGYII